MNQQSQQHLQESLLTVLRRYKADELAACGLTLSLRIGGTWTNSYRMTVDDLLGDDDDLTNFSLRLLERASSFEVLPLYSPWP